MGKAPLSYLACDFQGALTGTQRKTTILSEVVVTLWVKVESLAVNLVMRVARPALALKSRVGTASAAPEPSPVTEENSYSYKL